MNSKLYSAFTAAIPLAALAAFAALIIAGGYVVYSTAVQQHEDKQHRMRSPNVVTFIAPYGVEVEMLTVCLKGVAYWYNNKYVTFAPKLSATGSVVACDKDGVQ